MKIHSGGAHNQPLAEINVIPFVDIVLVLLIIFMITAPLLQTGMPVELPKAQAPEVKQESKDLILSIDSQNHIFLGDSRSPLTIDELTPKLAAIYQNKEKKALLIRADQKLLYGKVIEVMSIALKVGVERIGMITQPEK